jgi:hypothetical protein
METTAPRISRDWNPSPRILTVIVALVATLPYWFGVTNSFVYDDYGSIVENPFLNLPGSLAKTLTFQTFFDPTILDGQRPVVILSYLIDSNIWRDTSHTLLPFGFHLTNIALHAGTAVLFFLLLSALAVSPPLRMTATLLFSLHPAISEAVQLPAFREDLLAAFFTLAYLLLAVRGKLPAALIALALALCSKETAVVAPVLLIWLWLCFPQQSQIANRKSQIGISLALVAVYLAVTFTHRPLQAAGEVWNGLALRGADKFSTSPWIFARELKTLLWPHPLCADYVVKPVGFLDPKFFAGLAALLAVTAGAFLLRRKIPLAAFALGWLVINFAPISNIVPLFNPMADRYLYLPAIGFALLLGATLTKIPQRGAVFAVLFALYFALTANRVRVWRDDTTLWNATAQTEPRSARAQTWLGLLAMQRQDIAEATFRYRIADELNPRNVHALVNLAVLEGQANQLDSAEQKLRTATERRPDFADGWWNLATVLHMKGKHTEAQQALERAAKINPHDPRAQAMKRGN